MSAFLTAGAKNLSKCIICGERTAPGKKLCSNHEHLEIIVAAEKQGEAERRGEEFNLLEGACRSCQGNVNRQVLCTNLYVQFIGGRLVNFRDCGVYFKRMRAGGEFVDAEEEFEGFVKAQGLDW